jgi:GT2 family glycosyltransferase
MTPALSVVMPTYDRADLLGRVLLGYDRQSGDAPFELIAVDDGSTDGSAGILSSFQSRRFSLRPILLGKNGGPARARNAALAAATAPLVLIVGDDILPGPDFVARHLAAHRAHPEEEWAVLGRTVWPDDFPQNNVMRHIDGPGAQQFSYARLTDGQEVDFRHFYTSNVSLKRALFERVDPWFDTTFPHAAYEDVELAYRLQQAGGMRIHYSAGALATHYHHYSAWTFAERQYRCGLMSTVFLRKHPALRRLWPIARIHRLRRLSSLGPVRRLLEGAPAADVLAIERLGLELGSYYELHHAPMADRLYKLLFEYFVLKGTIDGELGGADAERTRRALLLLGLAHHLGATVETLQAWGEDHPRDVALALLEKAAPYRAAAAAWAWPLRLVLVQPIRDLIVPRH